MGCERGRYQVVVKGWSGSQRVRRKAIDSEWTLARRHHWDFVVFEIQRPIAPLIMHGAGMLYNSFRRVEVVDPVERTNRANTGGDATTVIKII